MAATSSAPDTYSTVKHTAMATKARVTRLSLTRCIHTMRFSPSSSPTPQMGCIHRYEYPLSLKSPAPSPGPSPR